MDDFYDRQTSRKFEGTNLSIESGRPAPLGNAESSATVRQGLANIMPKTTDVKRPIVAPGEILTEEEEAMVDPPATPAEEATFLAGLTAIREAERQALNDLHENIGN